MKKTLLLLSAFTFMGFNAQEACAFDHVHHQLEEQFPELKKQTELANAQIRNMDINSYLKSIGVASRDNANQIYEIPVVVHVIESSGPNTQPLTDLQIQNWIDNANKMYETTYGNGYYPEGEGIDGGTVMPFRLKLAKRTPNCEPTSGIIRYNGDSIPGYSTYGVQGVGDNGPTHLEISSQYVPHWPENSYYNIYVITGFDGDYNNWGLMGFALFPMVPDFAFHTFMKAAVVRRPNDSTLAHEFGHSLGLYHPFEGANSNGVATANEPVCPPNNNCQTDNDLVCDTEPTKSLISAFPTPSNAQINECTGVNYQGVQYNIMNYTNSPRKFTPGQRDRALAMFSLYRGSLFTSLGATEPTESTDLGIIPATCNVTGVEHAGMTGSYQAGPVKVELNNILSSSSAIDAQGANAYVDYTTQTCLSDKYATEIDKNQASTIKVTVTGANDQTVKGWIDYNNNGSFEDNEVIFEDTVPGPGWGVNTEKTYTFTPPANAVLDTYLRMRISGDLEATVAACGQYGYGQAEDYGVKIVTNLGVDDVKVSNKDFTVTYDNNNNTLELVGANKFGSYKIYDMSGKLIQSGVSDNSKIKVNNTPKGTYILQFEYNGENVSHKFIK